VVTANGKRNLSRARTNHSRERPTKPRHCAKDRFGEREKNAEAKTDPDGMQYEQDRRASKTADRSQDRANLEFGHGGAHRNPIKESRKRIGRQRQNPNLALTKIQAGKSLSKRQQNHDENGCNEDPNKPGGDREENRTNLVQEQKAHKMKNKIFIALHYN
jgi:hypothetical protein